MSEPSREPLTERQIRETAERLQALIEEEAARHLYEGFVLGIPEGQRETWLASEEPAPMPKGARLVKYFDRMYWNNKEAILHLIDQRKGLIAYAMHQIKKGNLPSNVASTSRGREPGDDLYQQALETLTEAKDYAKKLYERAAKLHDKFARDEHLVDVPDSDELQIIKAQTASYLADVKKIAAWTRPDSSSQPHEVIMNADDTPPLLLLMQLREEAIQMADRVSRNYLQG